MRVRARWVDGFGKIGPSGTDTTRAEMSRADKLRRVLEHIADCLERYRAEPENFPDDLQDSIDNAREALDEDDLDRFRPVASTLARTIVECDEQRTRVAGGAR